VRVARKDISTDAGREIRRVCNLCPSWSLSPLASVELIRAEIKIRAAK
jgi:hypothetical protein